MDTEMDTPRKSKPRSAGNDGFDVTRVVGRITFEDDGPMSAHEAAFALISREDAEGEYVFPLRDGRTCAVIVEYRDA